jgi:gamma-glutamylputrescine oxidase
VSPWLDRLRPAARPAFPAFRGEQAAPVVVVGGGLTGVMSAYACAAAGIEVVLLEADRLGSGGSGLAPGTVAAEGADSFRALEQLSGRRVARTHFELTRRAVLDLSATVRRLRIRADFEVGDAVRIVHAGADPEPWIREAGARAEAGLDGRWVKPSAAAQASGIVDARGGLRLSRWATCHPYRLVIGFAAAAAGRGAAIHERSPVKRVTFTKTEARVVTAGGAITTRAVLHCTGEPTALAGALRRHVRPMTRGLALTAPLGSAMRKAVGVVPAVVTDVHDPPHVVRWMEGPAALVAGADAPRPRGARPPGLDVQRTGQLMYELSLLYPAISGIPPAFGWSMPLGLTPDGGLVAGPHRNFPHQLFAFGTGHDAARAFLASRVLLRHVRGESTADDERLGFARFL